MVLGLGFRLQPLLPQAAAPCLQDVRARYKARDHGLVLVLVACYELRHAERSANDQQVWQKRPRKKIINEQEIDLLRSKK